MSTLEAESLPASTSHGRMSPLLSHPSHQKKKNKNQPGNTKHQTSRHINPGNQTNPLTSMRILDQTLKAPPNPITVNSYFPCFLVLRSTCDLSHCASHGDAGFSGKPQQYSDGWNKQSPEVRRALLGLLRCYC